MADEKHEWPEYLMIRDTGLHDDQGGGGQRIYTTAGRGYERQKYVRADLAALAQAPTGVKVKALDDDQIMEVIQECFPWRTEAKINDLLTYEKSPPMFPQATYDVPSYRAERFVRAIEARIHSALTQHTGQKPGDRAAQGTPADEQSGETSPALSPAQGLVEFAKEMCRVGFDGSDITGADILDTAVEHGLCRITQYHTGMDGIMNAEYLEEGDTVYVFAGPLSSHKEGDNG